MLWLSVLKTVPGRCMALLLDLTRLLGCIASWFLPAWFVASVRLSNASYRRQSWAQGVMLLVAESLPPFARGTSTPLMLPALVLAVTSAEQELAPRRMMDCASTGTSLALPFWFGIHDLRLTTSTTLHYTRRD